MPQLNRLALSALAVACVLAPTAGHAADDGEAIFKRNCFMCHTVEPGKNKIGPSLAGVIGRESGTVSGFSYSEANKNSHTTWAEANLDTYLTDPKKFMPGTKMVFAGLKKPEERQALIAYLKAHP